MPHPWNHPVFPMRVFSDFRHHRPRSFLFSPFSRGQSDRAFALVSVLAILALLLVLVLSISTVLHVETRSSASNKNLLIARENALLGLDTAMGQLQEYAGRDQAVTFPATTYYPTKDINLPAAASPGQGKGDLFDNTNYGYRKFAVTSKVRSYLNKVGTYLTPAERTTWDTAIKEYWNANRNPQWTGIIDASLRVDRTTNPNGAPAFLPAQRYESSTTSNPTTFGEPKRDQLPVWLVSGNEKFAIDQENDSAYPAGYYTPDKDITTQVSNDPNFTIPTGKTAADYIVTLVGEGSATTNATSADGMEGRVKAKKQELKAADATVTGHYAYWVGDESTKANFSARDRTSTDDSQYPDDVSKTSVTYRNRLQVPQRVGWENIIGFGNATFLANAPNLENISTSKEIGLLEDTNTSAIKAAAKANFHSLTAFSKSLFTDAALGGLKKDLTAYMQTGTGLTGSAPIADTGLYTNTDPRFKAWSGTNTGFPASTTNIPKWHQLRDWYNNSSSGGGSITPTADTAPVMTYIMFHAGWSYDGATKKIRCHWLPCIALWNPYDVGLSDATYDMEAGLSPQLCQLYVGKENSTLAELQKDVGAQWQGTEGNKSSYTFLDSDGITRKPLIVTANPDSVNMTSGPWPYDNDLTDGTTDAFGRFWYRLNASDSATYLSREASGSATNRGPLGPKNAGVRFNPHCSTSSPSVPVTQPLKFRISGSFGPGQVKVFTLPTTQQWSKSGTVTLTNTFDPDHPASLWFEIFDVANGPASSGGDLKFMFDQLSNTICAPTVSFKINSATIMQSAQLGGIGYGNMMIPIRGREYDGYTGYSTNGGANADGDSTINRDEANPKFVSMWRPLYDFGAFDSHMLTTVINSPGPPATSTILSSIWPYGATWIQPLLSDGGPDQVQVNERVPVFSRFNLGAKSWDAHPLVDAKRDRFNTNNNWGNGSPTRLEGLTRLSYIRFDESNSQKWDNNQADGDAGYALLTPKNIESINSANILGQSFLPIRNAKRANSEILSLGQFQQANLSPFFWEPSFPIGNSFAAPYTDREAIAGLNSRLIGGGGANLVGKVQADANNSTLDLSYLLNENLWDRYFLSSVPQSGAFNAADVLPNSRHRINGELAPAAANVRDFDTAAAYLYNVGALNVNSTSVDAWRALLTAFRDLKLGDTAANQNPAQTVPIARTLDPAQGAIGFTETAPSATVKQAMGITNTTNANGTGKDYSKIVGGFRYLTDAMIDTLAKRIVDEVRLRGPFLSLSDFVNRRLVAPEGSNIVGSDWYEARTNGYVGLEGGAGAGNSANYPPFLYGDAQSDFMNLTYDPFVGLHGLSGTLERAIQLSGINGGVNHPNPDADDRVYSVRIKNESYTDFSANGLNHFTSTTGSPIIGNDKVKHSQEPGIRSHLDTEHLAAAPVGEAGQLFDGTPGFVTQGDLLAMIGPALTPRGDTFLIRTYGDAVDKSGKVLARSYLEAIVQRESEPVTAAGTSGPDKWRPTDKYGRKFKIVKLRWLNPDEV